VEILVNLPAVANLIREGKTFQIASAMQTKRAQGMLTFDASVNDLIRQGVITRQDGMNFLGRRSHGSSSSGNGSSAAHPATTRELNPVSY
jgi:twitching motility protein PilT